MQAFPVACVLVPEAAPSTDTPNEVESVGVGRDWLRSPTSLSEARTDHASGTEEARPQQPRWSRPIPAT